MSEIVNTDRPGHPVMIVPLSSRTTESEEDKANFIEVVGRMIELCQNCGDSKAEQHVRVLFGYWIAPQQQRALCELATSSLGLGHGFDNHVMFILDKSKTEPYIIGFALYYQGNDILHISRIIVDKDHRRKKIATAILAGLAGERTSIQMRMRADVLPNEASIRLFVGRRFVFRPEPNVMQSPLAMKLGLEMCGRVAEGKWEEVSKDPKYQGMKNSDDGSYRMYYCGNIQPKLA